MSIDFRIDAEAGVIFTVAQGIVKADDIRRYYKEILADPLCRPGLCELVDARNADLEFTGDEARSLAYWFKEALPVTRIAVFAGSDAVVSGSAGFREGVHFDRCAIRARGSCPALILGRYRVEFWGGGAWGISTAIGER